MAAAPLPSFRAPSGRPCPVVSGAEGSVLQMGHPDPASQAQLCHLLHRPASPWPPYVQRWNGQKHSQCREANRERASKVMGLRRELGTRLGSFEGYSEDLKCPQGQGAKTVPEQGFLRRLLGI